MIGYRKVGGLHFLKVGRFGFVWFIRAKGPRNRPQRAKGSLVLAVGD